MSGIKAGRTTFMPYVPNILTGKYPDIQVEEGASVRLLNAEPSLQSFRPLDRVPAAALQGSAQPSAPEIVTFVRTGRKRHERFDPRMRLSFSGDILQEITTLMSNVQAFNRPYSHLEKLGGLKRIIIIADPEGMHLGVSRSLRRGEEKIAEQLGLEVGERLETDTVLRLKPDFLQGWNRSEMISALTHELYHNWCDRTFPEHAKRTDEQKDFEEKAESNGIGFWAFNALTAHSHLFLRYQLMRLGEPDFVTQDMHQLQESYDARQPKDIPVPTLMPFIVGALVDFAGTNRLIGDQQAVENIARWAARFINDRVEDTDQAKAIFNRSVDASSILFYQMCHEDVPREVLPYNGIAITLGSARAWQFGIEPPFPPVTQVPKQILSPQGSRALPSSQGKEVAALPSGSQAPAEVIDIDPTSAKPVAPKLGQRFLAIFSKPVRAKVKKMSKTRAEFKEAEKAERKLRKEEEPILKEFTRAAEAIETYLTQQRGLPAGRESLYEAHDKLQKFYYEHIRESGRDDLRVIYHLLTAQMLLYRYKDFPWRGVFFGPHEVGEALASAKMLAERSEIAELIELVDEIFQATSPILGGGQNPMRVDAHFGEDGHPVVVSTHTASF